MTVTSLGPVCGWPGVAGATLCTEAGLGYAGSLPASGGGGGVGEGGSGTSVADRDRFSGWAGLENDVQ